MLPYHLFTRFDFVPWAILIGYLLDLLVGDPDWLWHPVRLIGWGISTLERLLRSWFPKNARWERTGGLLLAIIMPCASYLCAWTVLAICTALHPALGLMASCIMCWQILAVKCLRDESLRVYHALTTGTLDDARQAVSRIVGRETAALDRAGVIRATVETVAENVSDGVIAPLLFLALGGAPLGWAYKAISTMDSMVGYKNERHRYFGWAGARLDDLANLIPARLSGLFIILWAYVCGLDGRGAWRIFRRDRHKHPSPNSAHGEAACAGALGVRLVGDLVYFGAVCRKPWLGDNIREIEPEDILRSHKLLYGAAFQGVILFTGMRLLLGALMGFY